MAAPVLLHGSENWSMARKSENELHSSEVKFLRGVKSCTRVRELGTRRSVHPYGWLSLRNKIW